MLGRRSESDGTRNRVGISPALSYDGIARTHLEALFGHLAQFVHLGE